MKKNNFTSSKIAIYPGCSLETSSSAFLKSLLCVLDLMGVHVRELENWSCCGASSAHAVNHSLHLALNLRNLSLAEEQGFTELLVPCAACFHHLAYSNYQFVSDSNLLNDVLSDTELKYSGSVNVRNILDFLVNDDIMGAKNISSFVSTPLTKLKAACYYGCLNTRLPHMEPFDSVEYPMSMDLALRAAGCDTVDWSYKTECCGAAHFITNESLSLKLVANILRDAEDCGADCIVVSCPMCHTNLDTKQKIIRKKYNLKKSLPILFVSQIIGLAFGINKKKLGMKQNFEAFNLLKKKDGPRIARIKKKMDTDNTDVMGKNK
ncbi:MAG: heterodisulfide reductase subunit B [bacterium]|nr:heterodisulfide reductase subunit B [bacterium]